MTRYTLDPEIVTGLCILGQRYRRLEAAADPAALADLDRERKRQEIARAAYEGNAEQQAAMKAARQTGDAELIAIEVGLANARVAAALQAREGVGPAVGSQEAERPSGGDISGVCG